MPKAKYESIYLQIRKDITDGKYEFGDYLPSENEYAERFDCTRNTIRETGTRGLTVGGHIIIGLPGETRQMLLQEAEILNTLPLDYLKFHQLQILKGTPMASEYKERPGDFSATMSLSGGSPSGWRKWRLR